MDCSGAELLVRTRIAVQLVFRWCGPQLTPIAFSRPQAADGMLRGLEGAVLLDVG